MKIFFLASLLIMTACGNVGGINLAQYPDPNASPERFILCHGYGCTHQTITNFRPSEWQAVLDIFEKESPSAAFEREKISKAIALMEEKIGKTVGTHIDLAKAPIRRQSKKELDCIDETVNTTKYLGFLKDVGVLKFHDVGTPVYKGYMIDGVYPHNSATIIEKETGDLYAVDSYIFANGKEPNIRGVESWLRYSADAIEDAHNLNRAVLDNL